MKRKYKRIIAIALLILLTVTSIPANGLSLKTASAAGSKIVYYDFKDYSSTIINDASGNGKAAVMRNYDKGGFKIVDTNIYGTPVKALSLPGGADGGYLEFPAGILSSSDNATVSMWVNLATDTGYQRIWDFGTGTNSYTYLLSDGGNDGFKGYASGITTGGWSKEKGVSLENGIQKNRWVLCTEVFEGSKMTLYANGQLVGTNDTGVKLSDLGNTTNNYIGYGQFGDAPTKGMFAEVSIYNYAMSASEVSSLYNVDDNGIAAGDAAQLDIGDVSAVTGDIQLPTVGANGSDITWAVSGSAISVTGSAITIDGNVAKVTRPAAGEADVTVPLTATIKYNSVTLEKNFNVTVLANFSDEKIVDHDMAAIKFTDLSAVIKDLTLPVKGEWGSSISWSVNPIGVIGTDGKVTRPEIGKSNATVVLTAAVSYGSIKKTKDFNVTVLAKKEAVEIKSYDPITVSTTAGYSPKLPSFVKVTYSDGSTGTLKTIWPVKLEVSQYSAVGTFKVPGKIVGETMSIEATVNVVAESAAVKNVLASPFDLNEITLDGDSLLTQNRDRTLAYLKLLDNKRMLYNFYKTYGETTKIEGVAPLGGWDEPTGLLRGHSTGHYMSALALAYASTGDSELKTKLNDMVHELRTMQLQSSGDPAAFKTKGTDQSVWSTDPTTWGDGFISAYSPDQFALLEQYTPYATIWAPYYTLHKLMAGFIDAYQYTGNTEALDAAKALGKWIYKRLSACTQEQLSKMWSMYIAGEFGGMNESLAKLYNITGDEEYLKAAKLFDNTTFFNNLSKNVDDIAGHHANQHIPQIIGAMEEYSATVKAGSPNMYYYNIGKNFWDLVESRYAYSTGGVGRGENFKDAYQLANNIDGSTNCETCAAYNMLKLTKMLYQYDPENADFMDYYERTLYNSIIPSQNPNVTSNMHNGVTYMHPIGPGAQKEYTDDYNSFTCCHGTGMENHVKYQEAAYFKKDNTLYVNLYIGSSVTWNEKGIKVSQVNQFPAESTKLTVSAATGSSITASGVNMKLRVPYWATDGFTVKVNGVTKIEKPEVSTYVELTDVKVGDVITIDMPFTYHLDKTPDKLGTSTVASVMYGPLVMVTKDSSKNWKTLILSNELSDSIKTDTSAAEPTLAINSMTFKPIYDAQNYAYHTYFKVLLGENDGAAWYEVAVNNTTAKYGTITSDKDMVKDGGNVTVKVVPKEGYMLKKLTVNGQAVSVGADNTYVISNVKAAVAIEGSFKLINPPAPDSTCLDKSATPTAHYTASWEKVDGINNVAFEPTVSKGGTGKGWGDYPTDAGSNAWVKYEWDTQVTMDTFKIFWYDDGGGTRVPAKISFDYLDASGNWKPVKMLSEYKDIIALDKYNTIKIEPVTGYGIRINMTIAGDASATGIYRWKVTGPAKDNGNTNPGGNTGGNGSGGSNTTTAPTNNASNDASKATTVEVTKDMKDIVIPNGDISKAITGAKDGKAEVDIKLAKGAVVDNITLTKDALKEAGKEKTDLVINMKDDTGATIASWEISGELLAKAKKIKNINLFVTVQDTDAKVLPSSGINGVVVDVAQDGKLNTQADLTVKVAGTASGQKVYIYKHNKDTNKLEMITGGYSKVISTDGTVTFGVLEGAEYVVLTNKADSEDITPLISQIKVAVSKNMIAVGKSNKIIVTLPACLEKKNKITDKTTSDAIGAVIISYKVSNKKIATIDSTGKITAKKAGTVTVSAKISLYDGATKTVSKKIVIK